VSSTADRGSLIPEQFARRSDQYAHAAICAA
jgi:hypothetical protein